MCGQINSHIIAKKSQCPSKWESNGESKTKVKGHRSGWLWLWLWLWLWGPFKWFSGRITFLSRHDNCAKVEPGTRFAAARWARGHRDPFASPPAEQLLCHAAPAPCAWSLAEPGLSWSRISVLPRLLLRHVKRATFGAGWHYKWPERSARACSLGYSFQRDRRRILSSSTSTLRGGVCVCWAEPVTTVSEWQGYRAKGQRYAEGVNKENKDISKKYQH